MANQNRIMSLLQQYIEQNTLVRISIVKGKGVRFDMPCRILHHDENKQQITVYHVDEKSVYIFNLTEVEDLIAN